jgi:hypothetical protein
MIARLRDLRRRREEYAKEAVIRRHAAAREAARKVEEASAAVGEHLQRTAEFEDAAFGSLVGQPVKVVSLYRLQGRFEVSARETEELRETEKRATLVEHQRKLELSSARSDHQASMKAVMKLDMLMENLAKRNARRGVALAELSEEEERGPARLPAER